MRRGTGATRRLYCCIALEPGSFDNPGWRADRAVLVVMGLSGEWRMMHV
jgi:hypothetical protein